MSARLESVLGAVLSCAILAAVAPAARAQGADHRDDGAIPARAATTTADSIRYAVKITDNNQFAITVTNYGFIGNNFVSRSSSLEYPAGSGYEHAVRAGLWFGARAIDDNGAFTGVVTGAVDGGQGTGSQSATEFTPAGLEIGIHSALPNSKYYNPNAVSEEDLTASFSDRPAKRSANNAEDHRPMGILVKQQNYMWSFSDYQHLVIFHYTIKNLGPPLANAYVGLYSEYASGSKNAYSSWPPSSSAGPGGWFNKKWIEYDNPLRLFREHFCFYGPIPSGCALKTVPYWVGTKPLGCTPGDINNPSDKQVTLSAWTWAPGSPLRDEDTERYGLMSAGTIQDLSASDLQAPQGDPVNVLSVGPFAQINPGDSVTVDFAIVGGAGLEDPSEIQRHATFAQRAYDRNYIVPIPPPSPRFKVVARNDSLDFYWDDSPESAIDVTSPNPMDFEGYRLYVGEERFGLHQFAQFDKATPPNDTTGYNTGFEAVRLAAPVTIDGVTYQYRYRLGALRNGFKYYAAITSFDLGNSEIESLESGTSQNEALAIPAPAAGELPGSGVTVFPNPYRVEAAWDQGTQVRDHYLWFANLPEHCTIRIYTLSGDLVYEKAFDGRTYSGDSARGIFDSRRSDSIRPTLSGRMFGWDMITKEGQAAATGLYLFSVDSGSGKPTVGKFLVVKSDREGF